MNVSRLRLPTAVMAAFAAMTAFVYRRRRPLLTRGRPALDCHANLLPMHIRDTESGYGLVTRLIHWLMAIAIFGVFALGYWMVTLSYDHPQYNSAPDLHRSLGILLGIALAARLLWRLINTHPDNGELSPFERIGAKAAHWGFYVLLAAITVSGYLITTSGGGPVDVFGLFSIPPAVVDKNLSDTAGYIHRWLAYIVIALAVLHSAAALKHHFVDRSSILKRMISGPPRN